MDLFFNVFRMPEGNRSFCSRLCHASAVRSTISRTISHNGLAGRRAVSAKRRTCSTVISCRLWLPVIRQRAARLSFELGARRGEIILAMPFASVITSLKR